MAKGVKMGKKTRATILTLLITVANSLATILFNLVYNNYLIKFYGSHVNGLISTLSQFVSLFTIIEGGFTTAAIVAMYKQLVNKDEKGINDILYTARIKYIRIGFIITIGVLIGGSIYIRFIDSPFSYSRTYALLIVSVLTTAGSLCVLSQFSILLQGDNKEYLQVLFSMIAKTATWIASIVMITKGQDIVLVYAMNLANVLLNICMIRYYEKKNYPYITYRGTYKPELISGTNDVLFQKVTNTIFTSTDLVLISICINLASASVYNVYYQIFRSIYSLLGAIVQAPFNSFGQLAADKNNKAALHQYFGIYQHLVLLISNILMTITGCMIIPFVSVYTKNITDINYVIYSLAYLFYLQIFSQVINRPYGTLLNATGKFKMQNKQCLLAAIVNILVSVSFIQQWGINSIIFGSFVGTLIILVMNIYQSYRNVLKCSCAHVIKNILVNYLIGIFCIMIAHSLSILTKSYFTWLLLAIPVGVLVAGIILGVNLIIDKATTVEVMQFIIKTIDNKHSRFTK